MLSVIIPTIKGREASLKRCFGSYKATLKDSGVPHEFVIVHDMKNWPAACNSGAKIAKGDMLHFTADDLEALPGWHKEALWTVVLGELPAPRVMNHSADGVFDNAGDGPDGALTQFTRIPLMTREQYDAIGPWPEIDYCSDVWLSERGRRLGYPTRMVYSYAFVHHWEQHGRIDTPDRLAWSQRQLLELVAAM